MSNPSFDRLLSIRGACVADALRTAHPSIDTPAISPDIQNAPTRAKGLHQ